MKYDLEQIKFGKSKMNAIANNHNEKFKVTSEPNCPAAANDGFSRELLVLFWEVLPRCSIDVVFFACIDDVDEYVLEENQTEFERQ